MFSEAVVELIRWCASLAHRMMGLGPFNNGLDITGFKVLDEEARRLHVHAHGAKDDGEVVRVVVRHVLALRTRESVCVCEWGWGRQWRRRRRRRRRLRASNERARKQIINKLACTRPACRQICAPISLCGNPAAEKSGIFCPRAIEFITSMACGGTHARKVGRGSACGARRGQCRWPQRVTSRRRRSPHA